MKTRPYSELTRRSLRSGINIGLTSSDLQSDLPLEKKAKKKVFVEKIIFFSFVRKSYNDQKCSEFRGASFGQDENFAKIKTREILIKNPRKMAKIDLLVKAAVGRVFFISRIFWFRWKDTSF